MNTSGEQTIATAEAAEMRLYFCGCLRVCQWPISESTGRRTVMGKREKSNNVSENWAVLVKIPQLMWKLSETRIQL